MRNNGIIFPYRKYYITDTYSRKKEVVFRPVLPVVFIKNSEKVKVLSYVDTGADETCFPGNLATYIGHNVEKGMPRCFSGVGGEITAYLHKTELEILGHRTTMNIYYSDDWNKSGIALLGQNSFFIKFDVLFKRKDRIFIVWFRG